MGKFVVPHLTGSSGNGMIAVGINTGKCGTESVSLEAGILFGAKGDEHSYSGKVVLILRMSVTYLIAIYLFMYSRGWVSPR